MRTREEGGEFAVGAVEVFEEGFESLAEGGVLVEEGLDRGEVGEGDADVGGGLGGGTGGLEGCGWVGHCGGGGSSKGWVCLVW